MSSTTLVNALKQAIAEGPALELLSRVSPNASPRQATIVIAASDSVNKAGADLVCDGAADQVNINTKIASAPAGAQIFFRAGHYYLTDSINVLQAAITLTGESLGW